MITGTALCCDGFVGAQGRMASSGVPVRQRCHSVAEGVGDGGGVVAAGRGDEHQEAPAVLGEAGDVV
jgi:hypothetical protein